MRFSCCDFETADQKQPTIRRKNISGLSPIELVYPQIPPSEFGEDEKPFGSIIVSSSSTKTNIKN